MIAYAQEGTELAHSFVAQINDIILFPLITLLTAIALLVFLWGGFQYVYNSGSEQGREQGRKHILWGIIGLLIMLSAYAILSIAANTFGIDTDEYSRPNSQAPSESSFPTARPSTESGATPAGGSPNSPGASNGGIETQVLNDMRANEVSDWEQAARLTAMTTGTEANRRDAINAAYSLEYISAETRALLLDSL
tara:strand:- start:684 stop:1265 length:582 start_codon:yes stop_codon:yes gene_type:complete